MTSYFDKAEREASHLTFLDADSYLEAMAAVEEPVIHDVTLNTGDREFPDDLRERILGIIAVKAVRGPGGLPTTARTRDYVLSVRRSELLADLHSAFHALASRRVKCRWGFWSDSPSQNLLSRKCHDEPEASSAEQD
jgi:hypothetical protein